MRYRVLVNEVWAREFEVEAESEADAYQFALEGQDCAEETDEFTFSYLLDRMPEDVTPLELIPEYGWREVLRDCDD